jgi:hypothetical protein
MQPEENDMARAGRKASANAKRRQTTRAAQGRLDEDKGTPQLRSLKLWATARADLPMEPLAVLYGHGKIDEAQYRAGIRLERARHACFGPDAAAERQFYTGSAAGGAPDQWAARRAAALAEGDARTEARVEAEYDRLLRALHRCGAAVQAATLGIATRPYAGAWVAAALAERDRRWTARHDTRIALIREGLSAVDKVGSRG